jgi:hypothetical protein
MGIEDMEITRDLERVLVRQDVNTQKLKFNVYGGKVRFSGELKQQRGNKEIEDKQEVKQLEKMIKRVDGIRTTEWDLKNWKKKNGKWVNEGDTQEDSTDEIKYGVDSDVELEW